MHNLLVLKQIIQTPVQADILFVTLDQMDKSFLSPHFNVRLGLILLTKLKVPPILRQAYSVLCEYVHMSEKNICIIVHHT